MDDTITISKSELSNIVRSTLSLGGFIQYNKAIALNISTDAAIMLGELSSEYEYWEANGGLTDDGYFFSTVDNVKSNTGLSRHQQKNALDAMEELSILSVDKRGTPQKRYIKIDFVELSRYLQSDNSNTSKIDVLDVQNVKNLRFKTSKINELKRQKLTNNKNNITKINNNISFTNVKEENTAPEPKAKTKKETYPDVIDSLITDDTMKTAIYDYTAMIKNAFGFPLPVKQLRTKIEDTLKLTSGDKDYFIEIFKNATDNCYKKLVDTREKRQSYSRQSYSQQKDESWDDIIAEINNGTYVPPVI